MFKCFFNILYEHKTYFIAKEETSAITFSINFERTNKTRNMCLLNVDH